MRLTKRDLLRLGGLGLAWPLLESVNPKSSRAQNGIAPRLVIVTTGQGTLLDRWTPPTLGDDALELSELLAPLENHQNQLLVISGIDNKMPEYHVSNGHNAPGHTLLNAHLCETSADSDGRLLDEGDRSEVGQPTLCVGPSIDHYLANSLDGSVPINLAIGSSGTGENRMYYRVTPERSAEPNGARAEALLRDDPGEVFDDYLAGAGGDSEPTSLTSRQKLDAQRLRIIDHAAASYAALSSKVSVDDRARLEAHAERLLDLAKRLSGQVVPASSCDPATLSRPDKGSGKVEQWSNHVDVLVNALACNVTRVISLHDSEYHGPNFEFLQDPVASELQALGAIALPGSPIEDWHAQVHGETGGRPNDNQNLIAGFTFYASQVRHLLDRMASIIEPDGNTLLHNSVVLWVSEFGDGGAHSSRRLPVVMAGNASGALETGRHLARSGFTTGDLYTSLLQVFGLPDEQFGFSGDDDLQHGGIPGLI